MNTFHIVFIFIIFAVSVSSWPQLKYDSHNSNRERSVSKSNPWIVNISFNTYSVNELTIHGGKLVIGSTGQDFCYNVSYWVLNKDSGDIQSFVQFPCRFGYSNVITYNEKWLGTGKFSIWAPYESTWINEGGMIPRNVTGKIKEQWYLSKTNTILTFIEYEQNHHSYYDIVCYDVERQAEKWRIINMTNNRPVVDEEENIFFVNIDSTKLYQLDSVNGKILGNTNFSYPEKIDSGIGLIVSNIGQPKFVFMFEHKFWYNAYRIHAVEPGKDGIIWTSDYYGYNLGEGYEFFLDNNGRFVVAPDYRSTRWEKSKLAILDSKNGEELNQIANHDYIHSIGITKRNNMVMVAKNRIDVLSLPTLGVQQSFNLNVNFTVGLDKCVLDDSSIYCCLVQYTTKWTISHQNCFKKPIN